MTKQWAYLMPQSLPTYRHSGESGQGTATHAKRQSQSYVVCTELQYGPFPAPFVTTSKVRLIVWH